MSSKTIKRDVDDTFPCVLVHYEEAVTTTVKHTVKGMTNVLPRLPLDMWMLITSFLCKVSKEKNTEAILSLTIVDGEWKIIVWHQQAPSAMHVKFDWTTPENKALLDKKTERALEQIHCTVHSHNKGAAGQSNDDADDELQKIGWHTTIGNCCIPKLTLHTRFNCQRPAEYGKDEDNMGEKIEDSYQEFLTAKTQGTIEEYDFGDTPESYRLSHEEMVHKNHFVDVPNEWMDRVDNSPPAKAKTTIVSYQKGGKTQGGFNPQNQTTPFDSGWEKKIQEQENQTKETGTSGTNNIDLDPELIDLSALFTTFVKERDPGWIISQFLYQGYIHEEKSIIEDIFLTSPKNQILDRVMDETLACAWDHFNEKGVKPIILNNMFPDSEDLVQDLIDIYHEAKNGTFLLWESNPNIANRSITNLLFENINKNYDFPCLFEHLDG